MVLTKKAPPSKSKSLKRPAAGILIVTRTALQRDSIAKFEHLLRFDQTALALQNSLGHCDRLLPSTSAHRRPFCWLAHGRQFPSRRLLVQGTYFLVRLDLPSTPSRPRCHAVFSTSESRHPTLLCPSFLEILPRRHLPIRTSAAMRIAARQYG